MSMEEGASGAVYNIGGGTEATLSEIIALGERLSGRSLEIVKKPAAAGDVKRTSADTGRIRRDTGWVPNIPLEAGFSQQLAWAGAL
jgi:nucleoside-diphosphate-sugar epimerase